MATVEQLTIQFEGKGAGVLTAQLKALSAAMDRLARRQRKVGDEVKKGGSSWTSYDRNVGKSMGITTKFGKSMSALRSKLLIWAFAVNLVQKAIMALMKSLFDFQKAMTSIETVIKSTGAAAGITAGELESMANSIQSSLGIANSAVMTMQSRLLTFTKITGKVFKEAQTAAIDMSTVFGQDLKQATIQLAKALNEPLQGLSALRRIGVSFNKEQKTQIELLMKQGNLFEAQKVILDELNKEFGGVTEAIRDQNTALKEYQDLAPNLSDFFRELGTVLSPVFGFLVKISNQIIKIATASSMLFRAMMSLAGGWKDANDILAELVSTLNGMFDITDETVELFSKAAKKSNGYAEELKNLDLIQESLKIHTHGYSKEILELAKNQALTFTGQQEWNKIAEEAKDALKSDDLDGFNEAMDKLAKILVNNNQSLSIASDLIKDNLTSYDQWGGILDGFSKTYGALPSIVGKSLEKIQDLHDQNQLYVKSSTNDDLVFTMEAQQIRNEFVKQSLEEMGTMISEQYKSQSQDRMAGIRDDMKADLENLKNQRSYQKASSKNQEKMEKEVEAKHKKRLKDEFKRLQDFERAGVIIDGARAAAKAVKASPVTFGMPFLGFVLAQTALQLATINSQKPPKMQYGGLVGGKPHSQGGTMIEAERGEFIVRKAAVDALGLEALNRINTGSGGGSVNISFAGNVLSKDFIEDEAIPQIKEAIRRGADIGIG